MMNKREHILEAAEGLFAEHGFEGTSVRALAAKANVNIAMISYYFGSKEKLFEALVEYRAGYMREKIKGLMKEIDDPVLRFDRLIEIYVDRIFDHHCFHRILHRQISLQLRNDLNIAISEILMKNLEEVRKIILDGQARNVFQQVDVELTIAAMIGTISYATLSPVLTCSLNNQSSSGQKSGNVEKRTRIKEFLKKVLHSYLLVPLPARGNEKS